MILLSDATIQEMAIHFVGSKSNDEGIVFSKVPSILNINEGAILKYFFKSFNNDILYQFFHESDLGLNEVFTYVSKIFSNPAELFSQSINIAKHLYEKSSHPNVKSGEFYVVLFNECIINENKVDAIGIFKSENKDTFLNVYRSEENFELESQTGININKLDKGCLIFNTDGDNGYNVAVVDNTNRGSEAQYWIDDFLHVRQLQDEYYKTHNMLALCKNFVTKELPQQFEVTKADQADFLNKSVKFFKENENFNMDDFENEVIGNAELIDSFHKYKSDYQEERDIEFSDSFSISDSAVKKQARAFKSVIKLDKNFHIYVHGNNEFIRKGFDQETGLNYYQIFFKEES